MDNRPSLFARLLDEYRRTGRLTGFSGGDGSDEGKDDSDTSSKDTTDANSGGKQEDTSKDKDSGGFKPPASQDELDRIITARLKRERESLTKTIRDEMNAEAARKEAEAKGEWEKVAKAKDEELTKLKADLAERDRQTLRAKAATKYRLPDDLASRLIGETEADLEEDAKRLAKLVNPPATDTEAGAGRRGQGSGKGSPTPVTTGKGDDQTTYAFIPAGAVKIPDGV